MKNIPENKTNSNIVPAAEDIPTADLLQNLSSRSNALEILARIVAAAEFELSMIHSLVMVLEEVSLIDDWGERTDYAGALQSYLFSLTAEHNEAFLDYKRNLAAGMLKMSGFDEPDETEATEPAAPSDLARTLSGILNHPSLPVEVYDALTQSFSDIFNNSANDSDVRKFETTPEYISMILDEAGDSENVDGQASVLDLSMCQPDQLNTKISELTAPDDLACVISGLLHNPALPKDVYQWITTGLGDAAKLNNYVTPVDTPEFILSVLKNSGGDE